MFTIEQNYTDICRANTLLLLITGANDACHDANPTWQYTSNDCIPLDDKWYYQVLCEEHAMGHT
jgi:hypothetical protein